MPDRTSAETHIATCGEATSSGLRLRPGLTYDAWILAGRHIARLTSASAWWLGDWLIYGEHAFGQRYRAALDLTGLDYKTLRNYAWVARRVGMSRRRDTLSFQHHAEVAPLSEPEQDLWLARAATRHWSRNELRRQLAEARPPQHPDDGRPLIVRVEIHHTRELRWRAAATNANQDLADWIATAADQAADAILEYRSETDERPLHVTAAS
jgi:hypothetical protein